MISIFFQKTDKVTADRNIRETIEGLEEGTYEMIIKKVRKQRSKEQNAYFHSVILPLVAEEMGEVYEGMPPALVHAGMENAKEALINRFLPKTTKKNPLDKRRKIVKQKRTSDCDTKEFRDMIEAILLAFPFIPPPDNGDWESACREMQKRYGNHQ
jgi:hypothetical protein